MYHLPHTLSDTFIFLLYCLTLAEFIWTKMQLKWEYCEILLYREYKIQKQNLFGEKS